MKKIFYLISMLFLASCSNSDRSANSFAVQPESTQAKYVFYFVGDGMSIPQITMAEKAVSLQSFRECFNNQTLNIYNVSDEKLNIRKFNVSGMANTHAENRFITCSAASATALATGNKTTINTISMNGDRTQRLESIAEKAKKSGMKVGVISSVSIDHATPACFYAHVPDRNMYQTIDSFLVESNFDFFGGGYVRHDSYKGKTADDFLNNLKDKGYKLCFGKSQVSQISKDDKKVFASYQKSLKNVCDGSSLAYNIDLQYQEAEDQVVLKDFVEKAIEVLDNENGFFLFCEGGKIDWADHANDAVTNVYETIGFDNAVKVAFDFYNKHKDETLIVFTGDHECGGLTLGYAGTHYESAFKLMENQKMSFVEFEQKVRKMANDKAKFEDVLLAIKENFGLGNDDLPLNELDKKRLKEAYELTLNGKSNLSNEEKDLYYGGYEPVTVTTTHILDNKAGVDWASYSHTALPVPVFAIGCGENNFKGYFDNTDIMKKIILSSMINE